MIIRTMKATFGTLAGDELKLDRGLNIIYAPNESGKSTWCAFLRAMLYGVDTAERARGGQLPAKTRYAPWSGAPMEGEITQPCNVVLSESYMICSPAAYPLPGVLPNILPL